MYCPNCKQEFDGKFCPECGTKLIEKHAADENVSMGVNLNLGDANAISGGVHVVNNTTYVQEREKSATEIEQEQRIQYMNLCEEVFEDAIIDEHEIIKLETERLRLGLDEETAKRIIETSRNASQTLKRELSPRDAIYLKTALQYINGNEIERIRTLLPKLEVMNELYKVEEVSFVYNLLLAALSPEKLIRTYEGQVADSYWQTYWVYIAYLKKAEIVKAEKALSRLNLYTKYPESNGYLLSALSSSFELDTVVAQDLLSVIPSSPCSPELKNFYESLIYEFAPQTAGEKDIQCHDVLFYVENIIHMDNPYKKAEIKNRTERAIENDKEKEEIEKIFEKGKTYYDRGERSESVKWFHMAAEQGHARAQCFLGTLYADGDGVNQDFKEAEKWYREAAEQGNTDAQNYLGVLYDNGNGVNQDYKEAEKWYRKAAEQGNAYAQNNLGLLYEDGNGVNQDYEEAKKWYRKAAEQGLRDAKENLNRLNLAHLRAVDLFKKREYVEAVKWFTLAAEQGDAVAQRNLVIAQRNLGLCYYNGEGVSQNYEEAVRWWSKAAEQGDADAQRNLGICYANGEGVSQNYEEAVKWYRMAAEQGLASAQFSLGCCYDDGEGVSQNYEEAARWCRKAAEQGLASAQRYLGFAYFNGEGVSQNDEEAVKWYRKAAEQGDAVAQRALGICYECGYGTSKNYEEAARWYRKAAEQGDDDAQYSMGKLFYFGRGVPQNNQKAREWWQKAAEQGNQDAIDCLNGKTPEDDEDEEN